MYLLGVVLGWSLLAHHVAAIPTKQALLHDTTTIWDIAEQSQHTEKKRPLHGRFLHMTDFHPDSFYQVYSSTTKDAACHRGQGPAGIYGAETSECDSPLALVNKTMEWIADRFKDEIDFVIWTGDSARHDSDEENPRSQKEILHLNEFMVNKMFEVFGKHNGDEEDDDPNNDFIVPIVPNIGNNDIMPHNIMTRGPNIWTRAYTSIWRHFIPEAQKHQFEQGGWFYVEVIPNKLAVFSLNTMYFFIKNAAVDGCAARSEPGYQQMEWLRIQLQSLRTRGVKAILTGHVPPNRQDAKTLWDETCWQKYALWLRQYRDVIITSAYGHFNYDHFLLQDFKDIDKDTESGVMRSLDATKADTEDDDLHALVSPNYFLQLRSDWADLPNPPKDMEASRDLHPRSSGDAIEDLEDRSWTQSLKDVVLFFKKGKKESDKEKQKRKQKKYLKKIGGKYAERFSASFLSASVVPNLFPTIRVFEYNTTGLAAVVRDEAIPDPPEVQSNFPDEVDAEKKKKKKKKKPKKYKFTVPEPPSKTSPPGPAYSPQTLSLLRYTQYFANLTHINNDFTTNAEVTTDFEAEKWHEGKHKGKKPHDKDHKPNPKKFEYEVYYDTKDDDVYHLEDLTVPSLVDLARRIGQFVPEELDKNDDSQDSLADSGGVDVDKKKGKKKHGKKKHGKKKHRKENEPWFTFMSRAFVGTMDSEELHDTFGQ